MPGCLLSVYKRPVETRRKAAVGSRARSSTGSKSAAQAPKAHRQLELGFPQRWGGARAGAGRKPQVGRKNVAHRARPLHRAATPVHVTLRSRLRSLRSQRVFPTLCEAIRAANRRAQSRCAVVHFSVQADHVHLVVEACDGRALSRGIQGLAVSIARRLNRLLFRRGSVFADRWHGRALGSPRAVRHAIAYVLGNFRKHGERGAELDLCSSAPWFRHFAELDGKTPLALAPALVPKADRARGSPVAEPATWLLAHGWLRHGAVSLAEAPGRTRQRS